MFAGLPAPPWEWNEGTALAVPEWREGGRRYSGQRKEAGGAFLDGGVCSRVGRE